MPDIPLDKKVGEKSLSDLFLQRTNAGHNGDLT
jgi:hypothetical protein